MSRHRLQSLFSPFPRHAARLEHVHQAAFTLDGLQECFLLFFRSDQHHARVAERVELDRLIRAFQWECGFGARYQVKVITATNQPMAVALLACRATHSVKSKFHPPFLSPPPRLIESMTMSRDFMNAGARPSTSLSTSFGDGGYGIDLKSCSG